MRAFSPLAVALFTTLFASTRSVPAAPPPRSASTAAQPAHLRVWKAECPDHPDLGIVLGNGEAGEKSAKKKPATSDVISLRAGYHFDAYRDVPARHHFPLVIPGTDHGAEPLVRGAEVVFAPGGYYTLLVRPDLNAPGHIRLDYFDDSPPAGKKPAAALSIHNLAPEVRDLRVGLGDTLTARFQGAGGYLHMVGVPAVLTAVQFNGTGAGGRTFEASAEANLQAVPRQSLIVFPDAYGRIRVQVLEDGPSGVTPTTEGAR